MKIFIALILNLLTFTSPLYGFTLAPANPPRFPDGKVIIRPSNQNCDNANLTAASLREFIQRAIDDYWATVPTTNLEFTIGETITVSDGLDFNQVLALASVGEIVVACSDNGAFTSGNTLAVGGMPSNSARGYVVINDRPDSRFGTSDEIARVSTFAHELGHAFGLGHSRIEYALMYYSVQQGVVNEYLSEDDADAVSYLYPRDKKLGGLAGACGTIDLGSNGDGPGSNGAILALGLSLLILSLTRLKETKQPFYLAR